MNDIAWSPDGNLLAVASTTGVYFYDTKTWQVAGTIPKGKSARNWVNSLVFSPDGKGVVFSSYEIAFSPDGSLLVTNTSDKIQFWEVASGKLLRELDGAFSAFAFSPDGNTLAIGLSNGQIEYWGVPIK